jgi:hypothetical protein
LYLGNKCPSPFERDRKTCTGNWLGMTSGEESSGIGDTGDATIMEIKAAHLIGCAKSILDGTNQAKS